MGVVCALADLSQCRLEGAAAAQGALASPSHGQSQLAQSPQAGTSPGPGPRVAASAGPASSARAAVRTRPASRLEGPRPRPIEFQYQLIGYPYQVRSVRDLFLRECAIGATEGGHTSRGDRELAKALRG